MAQAVERPPRAREASRSASRSPSLHVWIAEMPATVDAAGTFQNKPEEGSSRGGNYAEIRFGKSPQKGRRFQMAGSPGATPGEEPVHYVQVKFPRAPDRESRTRGAPPTHKRNRGDPRTHTAPHTPAWRLIAAILAASCLALVATGVALLTSLFSRLGEQQRKTSLGSHLSPHEECSCHPSARHCFGLGNTSYQVFHTMAAWEASREACGELGAHLLQIDTRGELEIVSTLQIEGWLLLKRMKANNRSWVWAAEPQLKQNLVNTQEWKENHCPYLRGGYVYSADCSSHKAYTCESSPEGGLQ